jgi:predicted phosphodiesterase
MRLAVISDIHSNLEALETALSQIKRLGYDEIICLGDIIGYGPNPIECLDLVFSHTNKIIRGNHENSAVNLYELNNMSDYSKKAMIWTIQQLKEKYFESIKTLRNSLEIEDLLFVHANPSKNNLWNYVRDADDAKIYFPDLKHRICFLGHSHLAKVFTENKNNSIDKNIKCIVNVGSIGQPRDGDPRLSYGIFDTDKWAYRNYRFEYDYRITVKKIRNVGLPDFLGERLMYGI